MEKTTNYQEKTKAELIALLQLTQKNSLDVIEESANFNQRLSIELEAKNKIIQKQESTIVGLS